MQERSTPQFIYHCDSPPKLQSVKRVLRDVKNISSELQVLSKLSSVTVLILGKQKQGSRMGGNNLIDWTDSDDFLLNWMDLDNSTVDRPLFELDTPPDADINTTSGAVWESLDSAMSDPGSAADDVPGRSGGLDTTTAATEVVSMLQTASHPPPAAPSGSGSISVAAEENTNDGDEVVINVVAIEEVPRKRKRGRGPKADASSPTAPASSRRQKKIKLYEVTQPFDDEVKEKRRLNAIKARQHRQLQKQEKEALMKEKQEAESEVAALRFEVEERKKSLAKLEEIMSGWVFRLTEAMNI
ncbi:uncharacterized protein [Macrobrachium rosenbergii]|uniref:uncharacterized protein n=1 Tax=Macrobrachium rosenbergii TaxID=79674 RepID=UPI0034D3E862